MARTTASLLLLLLSGLSWAQPVEEEEGEEAAAELLEVSLLQRDFHIRSPRAALQHAAAGGERSLAVPTFTLDLDLPPEQRWRGFYEPRREQLLALLPTEHPNATWLQSLQLDVDEEYMAELRGIVRAMNDSRVTMEALLWHELGYEHGVTKGCTAVLAAAADGRVFHGRNLDLPKGGLSYIPKLLDVTIARGGKPIALTTNFLFMVGIHTALRLDGYSVAQNTRNGCEDAEANAQAARAGARPFTFFLRHLVEEVPDFATAVKRSASAYLMAPQYFTFAGPGAWDAALVTRAREGIQEEPYANVLTLSPEINRWYIVETNDDVYDRPHDWRRPLALQKLRGMQPSQVNQDTVLDVMMMVPVYNYATVFTWIVDPSQNARRLVLANETVHSDKGMQGQILPCPSC